MRKIHFRWLFFLSVLMLFLVSACGGQSEATNQANAWQNETGKLENESGSNETSGKPIKLVIADSFPSGHYGPEFGTRPWMKEIEKLTKGRVQFEYYTSEQLGKISDLLDLVSQGTADIAYVPPTYFQGKMPLNQLHTLPGLFSDDTLVIATEAYNNVITQDPILSYEYLANNIRPMWGILLPTYNFVSMSPIEKVEDLQGLQIKSGGGYQDIVLKTLGGNPVNIPAPETYQAIERNTIDAVLWPATSVTEYRVHEVAKYFTYGFDATSFYLGYAINEDIWQSFPDDIKQIFEEANIKYSRIVVEKTLDLIEGKNQEMEDAGVIVSELSEEEQAKVKEILVPVQQRWIDEMESRGLAGQQVYDAFISKMEKLSGE